MQVDMKVEGKVKRRVVDGVTVALFGTSRWQDNQLWETLADPMVCMFGEIISRGD